MARLLPLFPLQLVVFPGAAVPLHIFEGRYKEMVGEAEANGTDFGIVRTIARGEETGIAQAGCTVHVESIVNRYTDGRFDVATRGRRRFRILSLDEQKDYLRGAVEYFSDDLAEDVAVPVLEIAFEAYDQLQLAMGKQLPIDRPQAAAHDLSFRLADDIDDLDFRSLLLQSQSEAERLKMFTEFVPEYLRRKQYVAHMQKKAPTNGSGHKRPGV